MWIQGLECLNFLPDLRWLIRLVIKVVVDKQEYNLSRTFNVASMIFSILGSPPEEEQCEFRITKSNWHELPLCLSGIANQPVKTYNWHVWHVWQISCIGILILQFRAKKIMSHINAEMQGLLKALRQKMAGLKLEVLNYLLESSGVNKKLHNGVLRKIIFSSSALWICRHLTPARLIIVLSMAWILFHE